MKETVSENDRRLCALEIKLELIERYLENVVKVLEEKFPELKKSHD